LVLILFIYLDGNNINNIENLVTINFGSLIILNLGNY